MRYIGYMKYINKQLKDCPFKEWFDVKGPCPQCGSETMQAMVTYLGDTGDFGDLTTRCMTCEFSDYDVAGWQYEDRPVQMWGRQFLPIKARMNVGPCVACGKLVVGGPIILFIKQGFGGQLDFCQGCFQDLGILQRAMGK